MEVTTPRQVSYSLDPADRITAVQDRTLIALSNHAARGGRAADILTKAGFKVAGAAGAEDYESQGGKLTKIVPPPPNPNANKQ